MEDNQSENKQGRGSKAINVVNSQARNRIRKELKKQLAKKLAAQGARTAITSLIAATSEFWIPALIILLIIIVFLVILFGGASNNTTLTPSPTLSPVPTVFPSSPPGAPVNALNVTARLKSDFNVIVNDPNLAHQLTIYNILAIPGKSSGYASLLRRAGPIQIDFNNAGCGGRVETKKQIILKSFFTYPCTIPVVMRYLLIHETGHILAWNIGRIYTSFNNFAYYPSDRNCYAQYGTRVDRFYLKTYPYVATSGGGGGLNESLAESISLYVLPRAALSNYQWQCPIGYNWAKGTIFGGYEF